MKHRNFIIVLIAALLFASGSAIADETKCRILDPTGTPLNVRTAPQGRVIGNLPNDMLVSVVDRAVDGTGKAWVYISKVTDGKPIGWVFRKFISCVE